MLPQNITAILNVALEDPKNASLFGALLDLLENASDSAIIVETLRRFPDDWREQADRSVRERAASLLDMAEQKAMADRWRNYDAESNVIPLRVSGAASDDVIVSKQPTVSLDDIAGLENVKQQIRRKIIRPFEKPDLYSQFGRKSGGGILMYGPPGCGKTLLAKAVAHECKASFVELLPSEILSGKWGESERRIETLFQHARASAPCVLFFDEVEVFAHRRNFSDSVYKADVISTFLREMDGVGRDREGVLYLGATNVPWSIDPAFRRPGRFDQTIFVPPPDKIARRYLLGKLIDNRPTQADINIDQIVEKTSGFSGADLEALIEAAVDNAVEDSVSEDHVVPLSNVHIVDALSGISPSIGEWLGLAKSYVEHANHEGQYDDLKAFLKKMK